MCCGFCVVLFLKDGCLAAIFTLLALNHCACRQNARRISYMELICGLSNHRNKQQRPPTPSALHAAPSRCPISLSCRTSHTASLGALTDLKVMVLHSFGTSSSFSGTMPTEYGRLTKLEALELAFNERVSGTIPSSYSSMTNISTAYFS